MKCVRITIIMKMGLAAVAIIAMNTVTSAGMSTAMSRNTSTAMTKSAAAAKLMLMKNMNMMPAVVKNMSTIITAAVVGKNTITNMVMLNVAVGMSTTTNISMEKTVAVGNITMNTKKAAAADMNIITVTTFRGTRRTVSAKSAIRMKNTATCAAKALKTVPAVCRTLTA